MEPRHCPIAVAARQSPPPCCPKGTSRSYVGDPGIHPGLRIRPPVVPRPSGPLKVTMKDVVAEGIVPLLFTANDGLDTGIALGSPVSLDYCEKAPFKFHGIIEKVHVTYVAAKQGTGGSP